jgi:hypothetical protein
METTSDETPLSEAKCKKFMSGLGCVGWMATSFRGDLSYAHSIIAHSMARPTQLAYYKILDGRRYLKGTITTAVFVPARKKGATLVMSSTAIQTSGMLFQSKITDDHVLAT